MEMNLSGPYPVVRKKRKKSFQLRNNLCVDKVFTRAQTRRNYTSMFSRIIHPLLFGLVETLGEEIIL